MKLQSLIQKRNREGDLNTGFTDRAQSWRLVTSQVYADSSSRKDAVLLNWTVTFYLPWDLKRRFLFLTSTAFKGSEKNGFWYQQNKQETEDQIIRIIFSPEPKTRVQKGYATLWIWDA
jgi:hypothetical protein